MSEPQPKNRGYFVHDVYEEDGIAIVARTAREAKKIGAEHLDICEWTDLRVNWKKEADVTGLPIGPVEDRKAIRIGLYGWIYTECDVCHMLAKCTFNNGKILCADCDCKHQPEA